MIDKKQLNIQLKAKQENNSFLDQIDQRKSELVDFKTADKATLLGKEAGEVVGGFRSLESVVDGAGETPLGTAMASMTASVPGIGDLFDPETATMNYSTPGFLDSDGSLAENTADSEGSALNLFSSVAPVGGGVATAVSSIISLITGLRSIQKLTDIASGGSSLTDLTGTAKEAAKKAVELKNEVTENIQNVQEAVGAAQEIATLATAVASGNPVAIISAVSAIPALNEAVPGLDNVSDLTGNGSLLSKATGLASKIEDIATPLNKITDQIERGLGGKLTEAFGEISGIASDFLSRTGIKTGKGFLPDFAEDLYRNLSSSIEQLTFGTNFSDAQLSELIQQGLSESATDRSKAVRTMLQNTTLFSPQLTRVIGDVKGAKTLNEFMDTVDEKAKSAGVSPEEITAFRQRAIDIEESLSQLNATISGNILKSSAEFYEEDVDLAELASRYKGAESAFSAFTYIESKEELAAEFSRAKREISEAIIHASETYTNANIGSEELHTLHNEKGFDGIQYHFVIRRDGKLQRGMTLDTTSEASNINGHNLRCIDVVLVGGLNCPSGTPNPLSYRSAQSFTRAQMKTLEAILEAFYRKYPGGQVMGHNEIFEEALDPYFEVTEYVQNMFRKENVYEDLLQDAAYEPKDLITQEVK